MNHSISTCSFAPDMVKSCKSFENFYLHRHSGRKLTWQPGLGNADVRAHFRSRTHELNVSTYALVILLLFEDLPENDVLTYEVSACQKSLFVVLNNGVLRYTRNSGMQHN